ncbi:MAG: class I SAM-dependent methyltransferase [Simkaniaceae bacterium]|nr:class I SAM-dependent methyltransferase [Simkaniaceae bacterium]
MIKNLVFAVACSTALFAGNVQKTTRGLYNHIKSHRSVFEGWCSEEKSLAMAKHIVKNQPNICVEIGVFGGSSIFPTATALKHNGHGVVYAIDPWSNAECAKHHKDGDENKRYWESVDLNKIYQGFLGQLRKFGLEKQCRVLRMTSEKALQVVPTKIDLLHIDGNHQDEACFFDTKHYFPRVKIGGYIWFDDIGWFDAISGKRQTKRSLDYLLKYCEVIQLVDKGGCALLRKKCDAPS